MMNSGMYKLGNEMVRIIEEYKTIHKFELIEKLGISVSKYDKFKPWFEWKYGNVVRYDKTSRLWVSIKFEEQDMISEMK